MNVRTPTLYFSAICLLAGCAHYPCKLGYYPQYPCSYEIGPRVPCSDTRNSFPTNAIEVREMSRRIEVIPGNTQSALVEFGNIHPNPTGVNAVKLASAIEDSLVDHLGYSVDNKSTRIIDDVVTLYTIPRENREFIDSEMIVATVKSDTKKVKIDAKCIRYLRTDYGPSQVTPPDQLTKDFLTKLKLALNKHAHLMREYR